MARRERTVSEIVAVAGRPQALVSQQLRILKDRGVLASRREGSHVHYGITDPSVLLLLECIRQHRQSSTFFTTESSIRTESGVYNAAVNSARRRRKLSFVRRSQTAGKVSTFSLSSRSRMRR